MMHVILFKDHDLHESEFPDWSFLRPGDAARTLHPQLQGSPRRPFVHHQHGQGHRATQGHRDLLHFRAQQETLSPSSN